MCVRSVLSWMCKTVKSFPEKLLHHLILNIQFCLEKIWPILPDRAKSVLSWMSSTVKPVLLWIWSKVSRPRPINYHLMVIGKDSNCNEEFMKNINIKLELCEQFLVDESDVILAFVPVVSRAGTDIEAALRKIPESRPVVLVVLHHTIDQDFVSPESRLTVHRDNVFTVDCMFHEDRGLLKCLQNLKAQEAVEEYLSGIKRTPKRLWE